MTALAERRPYLKALAGLAMPDRVKALPIDDRGYPVPWFVAEIAPGHWDFRVIGPGKLRAAVTKQLCWICGQRLGRNLAFVIGPMCSVNRITAEPPSHLECARFAAVACPFLANPAMRRNERNLPEERLDPPGRHSPDNPGAMVLWVTDHYKPRRDGIMDIGPPSLVEWYARGRLATRAEASAALEAGVERLFKVAEEEPGYRRQAGFDLLDRQVAVARGLLPKEERPP